MPVYQATPFKQSPQLLVQGRPEYVFGSFLDKTGPTLGNVISDSAVTTTATLKFQVLSGNAPAVGSLITVVGAANSANFNVTNAVILTASTTDAGVATVTYAISSTSQATLPDGGQVQVPQPELGDILVSPTTVSSVPVAVPASPSQQSGKSLSATVKLPAQQLGVSSTLSAVTVVIQGANFDEDKQYNTIGTLTAAGTASGGPNTYDWQSGQGVTNASGTGALADDGTNLPNFRFYRLQISGSGTGPVIGTIMI